MVRCEVDNASTAKTLSFTLGPRQDADASPIVFASNPTETTRYSGKQLLNCIEIHTRFTASTAEGQCRQGMSFSWPCR